MKKQLYQVKQFHKITQSYFNDFPEINIPQNIKDSRISLLEEEVSELIEAVRKSNSLEHIAKELADVLYVTYGTIVAYGLQEQFPEVFSEVHRSNMSKVDKNGNFELDKKRTKILKGKNYRKPNVNIKSRPKRTKK